MTTAKSAAPGTAARPNPWLFTGILAPLLYLAAVVLGGILTPGYSHVAGPISALIMAGAPATPVLVPLFAIYNALVAAFAFALPDGFHQKGVRISLFAPIVLVVVSIAGAAMLLYSMDPLGAPATSTGTFHVFLAGIASLGSMLAILSIARSLRDYPAWRGLARLSWIALVAVLVSGGLAASAAASLSPLMGLAERVTIGLFLAWLVVVAISLIRR